MRIGTTDVSEETLKQATERLSYREAQVLVADLVRIGAVLAGDDEEGKKPVDQETLDAWAKFNPLLGFAAE